MARRSVALSDHVLDRFAQPDSAAAWVNPRRLPDLRRQIVALLEL
jgi:hypothetical protein